MITVRHSGAADAGAVERHLNAALSEASIYRGRHEQHAGAETVLVAEIEGCVVGSLAYTSRDESWQVVRCHVEKEFRGVGVGDHLMDAFLGAARDAGVSRVGGEALPGDRATKNLFERNGLVARLILVERNLD